MSSPNSDIFWHRFQNEIVPPLGTIKYHSTSTIRKNDSLVIYNQKYQQCDETKKEFNSIDGLINNAGLMPLSYVKNLHTDEWDKMIDVNIKGVMNGVAAVLPTMMEQKSGNIINISSSAANKIYPGGAIYCATKSAVKMFSEGLRMELAPKFGINVTSIEPGFVDTELTDSITDDEIKEELLSNFKEMTPLEAQDIADAIYYSLTQPKRANVNDVFIMPTDQEQ